jgi:GNAT superfamily N-acetyltransferase
LISVRARVSPPSRQSASRGEVHADGFLYRFFTGLFVDPDRMRQGIGRALVRDVVAIVRGRGVRRVEVTANQHALAFYEGSGFVVDREVQTQCGLAQVDHEGQPGAEPGETGLSPG